MPNFWIYMFGIAVVAGALGYGAHLLGAPMVWLGIGVAIIIGMGIMGAVRKTQAEEND